MRTTATPSRRGRWLVAALLLLGLGGLLMSLGDEKAVAPAPTVHVPRRMDEKARARLKRRQIPLFAPAPATAASEPIPAPPPRDPLLAALPPTVKRNAFVLEVNALRHTPVGQLLIDCLDREGGAQMKRWQTETGIDPFQDLDRVAVVDDNVVLSGFFEKARWDKAFPGDSAEVMGDQGRLFRNPAGQPRAVAWGDSLMMMVRDEGEARAMVDRLEGRAPVAAPIIPEAEAYGELYGFVTSDMFAKLLGSERSDLATRLGGFADRVQLHVDATKDVGIVAGLKGKGSEKEADELGRAVGGALALGRLKARADGNTDLALLMDNARVQPGGSGMKIELGVPMSFLEQKLRDCGRRFRTPTTPASPGATTK